MTLEAWVNPSTVNGTWRDVIYKGNDNFYLEGTSTSASSPDAGMIAGGTYADAFGTSALPANTWSYLTETYDGSTLRLYVNGTQVASTAHTGNIATSTNPLQIGGDSIYGQFFAGMIDEVRVYNTALTAAQIQTDEGNPIVGADGSRNIDRNPDHRRARSTWPGAHPPASTASPATRSNAARAATAPTSPRSPHQPPPPTSDTSVSANTIYSYRVRAVDSVGNLGPYSNVATATTGLSVTPGTAVVTFTGTAQFIAAGPWQRVGNVVGRRRGRRQLHRWDDHDRRPLHAAKHRRQAYRHGNLRDSDCQCNRLRE